MSLYSRLDDARRVSTDYLQTIPLFAALSVEQLAEVVPLMYSRSYAPGIILFHQGMPGTTLYLIEEGQVRLYSVSHQGNEHTLSIYGAGDIFGELALLDGLPRSTSAITIKQTAVWLLVKHDLDQLMVRYPVMARSMNRILARRIRATATHVEAIIFQDVIGRLAYELLNLSEQHGRHNGEEVVIDVPLTQADLGAIVGATRESVNKALTMLRQRKLIQVEGVQLTVINPAGLQNLLVERKP
jgi:CRP/FNR family transcriptional regulator/CRP/FNR family cyclic AMP-dependent transcriptional regulator